MSLRSWPQPPSPHSATRSCHHYSRGTVSCRAVSVNVSHGPGNLVIGIPPRGIVVGATSEPKRPSWPPEAVHRTQANVQRSRLSWARQSRRRPGWEGHLTCVASGRAPRASVGLAVVGLRFTDRIGARGVPAQVTPVRRVREAPLVLGNVVYLVVPIGLCLYVDAEVGHLLLQSMCRCLQHTMGHRQLLGARLAGCPEDASRNRHTPLRRQRTARHQRAESTAGLHSLPPFRIMVECLDHQACWFAP
jgi:hypothetical protein